MLFIYQICQYYVKSGGIINLLLFVICFLIFFLGSGKALQIFRNLNSSKKWRAKITGSDAYSINKYTVYYELDEYRNCLLQKNSDLISSDEFVNRFREILLKYIPQFESGFDTIAVCIAIAPLLGLLGTVTGMMNTFQIIMEYGVANPCLLSQGISTALITTQAGLVVAFPSLLFHNFINNRKNDLIKRLLSDGEWIINEINKDKNNV